MDISVGVDGSIWALLCEPNVTDYKIIKWQIIHRRWYYVPGCTGVLLSAYNEISVAVLNSKGIIKLSSPTNSSRSDEPTYLSENSTDSS